MAKENRRIRAKDVIITIILLAIITSLVIINIKYTNNYTTILNSNQKQEKKLEEYNNQYLTKVNEYEKIEQDTESINNIEKDIINQENNYYEKLKEFETLVYEGKSKYKIAYLTFDDGPYYLTYDYLKVLDKYNVKATFFTIGLGKEKCLDNRSVSCHNLYKEITDRGHTIANHTYSHLIFNGLYNNVNSFVSSVQKQEQLIKEKTGVTTNIVRFPGGSRTAGKLKDGIIAELRKNGYGWVDWTAQDGDGASLSSKEQAMTTFKNSINENIEVILLHDYNHITLSVLPEMIEYLQDNNYILLPLFYESRMVNK